MKLRDPADDSIFEGTPEEIVVAMSQTKFRPVRGVSNYRRATAKRVKELFDFDVDPSSNESFVASMVEYGLLEEVK